MPNDTTQTMPAELPEHQYRALQEYAEDNGLSLDQAILRLASESLAMRQLGNRLGVQNFERAPR